MTGQSNPTPNDIGPRAKRYLGDMFGMNPVWESQNILSYRREHLRLPAIELADAGSSDNYDQQQQLRQRGRQRLKRIQEHFFQMPSDELMAHLDSLPAEKHPELASTVSRLTTAAPYRSSINAMLDDPKLDRDLVIAFGRALTLTPADAGFAKEQYLQALNRGRNYGKAVETIRQFERLNPSLIELERDWFAAIHRQRRPWFSGVNSGVWIAVGSFLAGMVVRFVAQAFNSQP